MTNTETTGVTQRTCAWCTDRVGVAQYIELRYHTISGHEATYLCSENCLQRWIDAD